MSRSFEMEETGKETRKHGLSVGTNQSLLADVQDAEGKSQAHVITMVGRPGYHAKVCALSLGDGRKPKWTFCCCSLVGIF